MNRHTVHLMNFVLYSPRELVNSGGAGFWSNDEGWVEFKAATRFTVQSVPSCNLPIGDGQDAKWIMWEPDAVTMGAGTTARPAQICLPLSVQ